MDKEFTQEDLATIIEPRVQEIFQLVRQEIKRLGYSELPGGYILTGALCPCLVSCRWHKMSWRLPYGLRFPISSVFVIRDTAAVGILHNAIRNVRVRNTGGSNNSGGNSKKPVNRASGKILSQRTQETSQKPGFIERLKRCSASLYSGFIRLWTCHPRTLRGDGLDVGI